MSLLDEFKADVRASAGRSLRWGVGAFAAIILTFSVIAGAVYMFSGKGQPPQGARDAARIPVNTQTAAAIDVFGCIRQPQCTKIDKSKQYLTQVIPVDGFRYTPLGASDGQTRTFVPARASAEDWVSVADAVTVDGLANGGAVTDHSVTVDGSRGRFTVTDHGHTLDGTAEFRLGQGNIALLSLTYASRQ